MTREEAKNNLTEYFEEFSLVGDVFNMYDLARDEIDSIYDDFESRTCESCKYLSTTSYISSKLKIFEHSCANQQTYFNEVDLLDGCNKWEKK